MSRIETSSFDYSDKDQYYAQQITIVLYIALLTDHLSYV
jgi:hypothetical protein